MTKKNNASSLEEVVQFGTNNALTTTFTSNVGIGTTLNLGRELLVKGEIAALDNTGTNDNQILMAVNNTIGNLAVTYGSTGSYVPFQLETSGTPRFTVSTAGAIKFNAYDSTNQTGTPTYLLGTDASGNIVKTTTIPGSGAGPYLPLAGGTMTGTSSVLMPDSFKLKLGTGGDAIIQHNGSHLFIDNSTGNTYVRNTSTGSILLRNSTGGDIQFDNEFAGNILFNTSNIERMRIDSSGNVGVGTTTLTNSSGYKTLSISGSAGAQIAFQTSGTGKSFIFNDATDFYIYNSEAGNLKLFTAATERMRIDSAGNVGIGLTPNVSYSKLQIKTPSSAYGLDLVGRDAGSSSESQITFWNSNQTSVLAAIVNSSDSLLFYTGTTERMRISSAGAIKFNAYDSTNNTGTPTYLLGTDASGNVVKTNSAPSPITSQAASLYDLIPNGAFTTTYAFTSTAGTYAKVMQGDDVITANGTYTVQMFVDDYAVGGTQYSETYSGIMSWGSSTNTNDTGGGTISEIVLHRSGHAANQGMTYLRTRETTSSEGSELRLEIMCNRTYTGASNVVFKFVRLI